MATVGDMLRLARQRLGMTQKAAASRLGVVQPVLSRLENGASEPDAQLLLKAAQVYVVPVEFFEITDPVFGSPVSVHTMLRGKADVTARDVDMITAESNIRLMHLRLFLEGVDFEPTSEVPSLDVEQYGTPERVAGIVRSHWGVASGAIKNLTALVERAGVIVGWSKFKGASVSGVTFRAPGRPPLVLLNAMHPADRMRFTLAHEIGHLVMHRFPTPNMETEANLFAAALLMPAADIKPSFMARNLNLTTLAALKPEWKVAMQALLVRAESLNVVTKNQSRYLWQQISARGWRMREPAELDFPHEQPKVLQSILRTHLTDLKYSVDDLANLVRMHRPEFAEFYGILDSEAIARPKLRVVS